MKCSHLNHEMLAFHFFRLLNNLFKFNFMHNIFCKRQNTWLSALVDFSGVFFKYNWKNYYNFLFLYLITTTSIFLDSLKGALL